MQLNKLFVLVIMLLLLVGVVSAVNLTASLENYYKADNNTDFIDEVGNDNGTISGATYTASGKINGTYGFDGNDKITISDGVDYATHSIDFWIKVNSDTSKAIFTVSRDGTRNFGSVQVVSNGSGSVAFSHFIRSGTTSETNLINAKTDYSFSLDTWHHVVSVMGVGGNKIYVNSVNQTLTYIIGNAATTSSFANIAGGAGANYLRLGTFYYDSADHNMLDGYLDELGIWSKALNQSEIDELYNSNVGFQYPFKVLTNFSTIDFYTGVNLTSVNYTIDGVQNTSFYLIPSEYTVLMEATHYISQNFTFTVTALDNTTVATDGLVYDADWLNSSTSKAVSALNLTLNSAINLSNWDYSPSAITWGTWPTSSPYNYIYYWDETEVEPVNQNSITYSYSIENLNPLTNLTVQIKNNVDTMIVNSAYEPYCYQETANVSTGCGDLATGSYSAAANYLYTNYSIPPNANSASWLVFYGNRAAYNLTIPDACFNDPLQVQMLGSGNTGYMYCYNGTDWDLLDSYYRGFGGWGIPIWPPSIMYDGVYDGKGCYPNGDCWNACTRGSCLKEEAIYWIITNTEGDYNLKYSLNDSYSTATSFNTSYVNFTVENGTTEYLSLFLDVNNKTISWWANSTSNYNASGDLNLSLSIVEG